MTKLSIRIAAIAIGLCAVSAPAAASDATTISVRYADLDLTSASGQAALEGRVRSAARRLCADRLGGDGAWGPREHAACVRLATESARPQVERLVARANGPQYAGRNPATVPGR